MTAPIEVSALVERFRDNRGDYKSPRYNETQLRRVFLGPLFDNRPRRSCLGGFCRIPAEREDDTSPDADDREDPAAQAVPILAGGLSRPALSDLQASHR
jgi:hypothetical protein